jgi:hypothetical protein
MKTQKLSQIKPNKAADMKSGNNRGRGGFVRPGTEQSVDRRNGCADLGAENHPFSRRGAKVPAGRSLTRFQNQDGMPKIPEIFSLKFSPSLI